MSFPFGSLKSKHYTTAAGNQVFGGATVQSGNFYSITINKATTGTVTIADTDGTTSVTLAVIAASTPAQTLWYGTSIARGLLVTNASAEDFTVNYDLNS